MPRNYTIVPAEPAHVAELAGRLREGDANEIEAAGIGANKALWRSYRGAMIAKTAFVSGEIAAMWGMGGCPLGRVGRPWLLTAPAIERAKIAFVREARAEVANMLWICPELRGYVDDGYPRALRLLTALGFALSAPFPFGPHEAPFRCYTMRRSG